MSASHITAWQEHLRRYYEPDLGVDGDFGKNTLAASLDATDTSTEPITAAKAMMVTPYDIAEKFLGLEEISGHVHNAQIMAMLQLDADWPSSDEVPWCSAFPNYICWLLGLPRTKSLLARSWLAVGAAIALADAVPGFDLVVLKRGSGPQPGPENLTAPGHVGFFAGMGGPGYVRLLGGNQGDQVSIAQFGVGSVIGTRRLAGWGPTRYPEGVRAMTNTFTGGPPTNGWWDGATAAEKERQP